MSDLKEVHIYRDKWCRGGKGGRSALLNMNGNLCCLGFLGRACGLTDAQMLNRVSPATLDIAQYSGPIAQLVDPACGYSTPLCCGLMGTNDSVVLLDDRETTLTNLFKSGLGLDVYFWDSEEHRAAQTQCPNPL